MHYAELHCRTNFSFLEGASHAEELVLTAVELGYAALAVTDRNSLAGVVRAHGAAKDAGLKLLIGAEVTPTDAATVVLWAPDRESYGRLSRLLTVGRRRAEKGSCELTLDDLAEHSAGLLAGVAPQRDDSLCSLADLHTYREMFGNRCYLLAELHYGVDDGRRLEQLLRLSRASRVPLVAAGDVHYHAPERMALQHVLTAIRHGTTVAELGERCLPNAERHLRNLEQLLEIYSRVPQALRRTTEIADRCTFSLSELRHDYPEELAPEGETPMSYLRRMTWEHANQSFAGQIPDKVRKLLEHELTLIEELK
jgi:error-prone DNA polymerase